MGIDVEAYYEKYGPMVLRRCRWLLKEENNALDAMQDVFVLLIKNQRRLKGDYPSSLLFRMATNVCLNKIRSQKRRSETGNEDILASIAGYEDIETNHAAKDILNRIFNREPESTKAIAVLYYIDGMTLQQVADEVGMSVSGIRKRLMALKSRVKNDNIQF